MLALEAPLFEVAVRALKTEIGRRTIPRSANLRRSRGGNPQRSLRDRHCGCKNDPSRR